MTCTCGINQGNDPSMESRAERLVVPADSTRRPAGRARPLRTWQQLTAMSDAPLPRRPDLGVKQLRLDERRSCTLSRGR